MTDCTRCDDGFIRYEAMGEACTVYCDCEKGRMLKTASARHKLFEEIDEERNRQDKKWGEQNLPDFSKFSKSLLPGEHEAKYFCERATQSGTLSFLLIMIEELCEAVEAENVKHRREELVQVAAVVVQWIEAIDRRAK